MFEGRLPGIHTRAHRFWPRTMRRGGTPYPNRDLACGDLKTNNPKDKKVIIVKQWWVISKRGWRMVLGLERAKKKKGDNLDYSDTENCKKWMSGPGERNITTTCYCDASSSCHFFSYVPILMYAKSLRSIFKLASRTTAKTKKKKAALWHSSDEKANEQCCATK